MKKLFVLLLSLFCISMVAYGELSKVPPSSIYTGTDQMLYNSYEGQMLRTLTTFPAAWDTLDIDFDNADTILVNVIDRLRSDCAVRMMYLHCDKKVKVEIAAPDINAFTDVVRTDMVTFVRQGLDTTHVSSLPILLSVCDTLRIIGLEDNCYLAFEIYTSCE